MGAISSLLMGDQPKSTARGMHPHVITRFRGINQYTSIAVLSPEYALDCSNVIVNKSGTLSKFRVPVPYTLINPHGLSFGPNKFFDFRQGTGTRLIVMSFNKYLDYSINSGVYPYDITQIESNLLDVGTWDMVESNNIVFGCNGGRMVKWLGLGYLIQNWGIAPHPTIPVPGFPSAPITITSVARVAGVVTVTTSTPHNFAVGNFVSLAGVTPVGSTVFNTTKPAPRINFIVNATQFQYRQLGVADDTGTGGSCTVGPNLLVGRSYKVSGKNTITGHYSNMSFPTNPTTPLIASGIPLTLTAHPDAQCNALAVFATLDGGSLYYLLADNLPNVTGLFIDTVPDESINTAVVGPLLNNPPLPCRYLTRSQGRIFGFNLLADPQSIIYSGYEKILLGRPEESFPPSNRLQLALNADPIRGGGVIQAGVVAFSESNQMYMFRGQVEDISISAPVSYSATLEELPWQEGLTSHFSVQSTPEGLLYWASDRVVKIYTGVGRPVPLSIGVHPILSNTNPNLDANAPSSFFNYADREWYSLIVATPDSGVYNKILIFDVDPNPETNAGIFIIDVQADSIGVIEDINGGRRLVIGQGGKLYYLPSAISDVISGLTALPSSTTGSMNAFYRTGYFGNDSPNVVKMFRWVQAITDQPGFQFQSWLVDDVQRTFMTPEFIDYKTPIGGRFSINRKARRCSITMIFPEADESCNLVSLSVMYKPMSSRPR